MGHCLPAVIVTIPSEECFMLYQSLHSEKKWFWFWKNNMIGKLFACSDCDKAFREVISMCTKAFKYSKEKLFGFWKVHLERETVRLQFLWWGLQRSDFILQQKPSLWGEVVWILKWQHDWDTVCLQWLWQGLQRSDIILHHSPLWGKVVWILK